MKTKIVILITFILLSNYSFPQQITADDYDKLIDYCACKIAYTYTKNYAAANKEKTEARSFNDSINLKLKSFDLNSVELDSLLSRNNFAKYNASLKKRIETTKSEILLSYTIEENKEQIQSNLFNYNKESDFSVFFSNTPNELISLKEDIENSINKKLEPFIISTPQKEEKKEEIEDKNGEQSPVVKNRIKWEYFLAIPILLFLFYILFKQQILKLNNKIDTKVSKDHFEEFETYKDRIDINNQDLFKKIDTLKKDLDHKISDLSDAIALLQTKDSSNGHTNEVSSPKIIPQKEESQTELNNYYAPRPNKDGEFLETSFSKTNKDSKYYIITLVDDRNAEFTFLSSEDTVLEATNSPERYIDLACNAINPLNQHAQKIITDTPGTAIKKDNKWVVETKAKIRYE